MKTEIIVKQPNIQRDFVLQHGLKC